MVLKIIALKLIYKFYNFNAKHRHIARMKLWALSNLRCNTTKYASHGFLLIIYNFTYNTVI